MATPPAAPVTDADLLLLAGIAQAGGSIPPDLLAVLYSESSLQTNAGAARVPNIALGIQQVSWIGAQALGLTHEQWLDIPNQSFATQLGYVKRTMEMLRPSTGYPNAVALYQHNFAPSIVGPSVLYRAPSDNYTANAFMDHGKKGYIDSEDLRLFLLGRLANPSFDDYLARLRKVIGDPTAKPRIPAEPIYVDPKSNPPHGALGAPEAKSTSYAPYLLAGAVGVGAFFLWRSMKASPTSSEQD